MRGRSLLYLSHFWGTDLPECQIEFPCDRYLAHHDDAYFRGITIQANLHIIYRWICQLRTETFSYGFKGLDLPGREPEEIRLGQEVMGMFEIVDFEPNRYLTIRIKQGSLAARIYGQVAVSYLILPKSDERCRLLVKILIRYPKVLGLLTRWILPWGDLIMMRKQLLNFKNLAERTQRGE